jgi:hypothetical protein
MRLPTFRHLVLPVVLFVSVSGASGCGSPEESEVDADAAFAELARPLEADVRLLGGSEEDLAALLAVLDTRAHDLQGRKDASKVQAKTDVEGYTPEQWDRSFFRRDEMDQAIDARARDIFDRPDRRALEGVKAQRKLVRELADLVRSGEAGTLDAPSARASYIREGYVEIALSIALNDKLGIGPQIGAQLSHFLRKKFPWLGKIFKGMRRDRRAPGLEGEAVNIDRSGPLEDLWRRDPITSTVWRKRNPADITPAKLYGGPWFGGIAPKLPEPEEVWQLAGFRSQKADGANASVDIRLGGQKIKVKLDYQQDQYVQAQNARILWAIGYETDPQYTLRSVRMEARAFIAAQTAASRIGLRFGPKDDEIVPARPPRGFSFPLKGMRKAPGANGISLRYRDGHEETSDAALDSLEKAIDDRAHLDTLESVLVQRPSVEIDQPIKRDAVGPWDFDADAHVDDREVRAIGIVFGAWLGTFDLKFNNVRLDLQEGKDGSALYLHTLSDTGGLIKNFGFEVGIDPDGRFLHPDINKYTVAAFDRLTANDAKWAISKIAQLSEEQILAAFATGAFTGEALALHVEKLVARRDDLIKTFGLQNELPLLRPNGPNRNPPPRYYEPPAE